MILVCSVAGFVIGMAVGVWLLAMVEAARKGDCQGKPKPVSDGLEEKCKNVLEGATALEAKFFAAPYGNLFDSVDVTDIVVSALMEITKGGYDG